jgi:hypothetical protein
MKCRHCAEAVVSRPRGLCWSCYYTTGVREQYPSTSKYGRRGLGNFSGRGAPATLPTDARPGSLEKIAVLMERVRLRQSLWHPHDATFAPVRTPLAG